MSNARTCKVCGEGKIVSAKKAGRTGLYKRLEVPIPQDYPIRTCTHCSEQFFNRREAKELDEQLEQTVKRAIERMVETLETRATQVILERALGLSAGYLSKVKRGERSPSASLFRSFSYFLNKSRDGTALPAGEFGRELPHLRAFRWTGNSVGIRREKASRVFCETIVPS